MAGCATMLRPGGTLVITSRPVRRRPDDLIDLPGQLLAAGPEPVERCAALLAAVRDGGAGGACPAYREEGEHAGTVDDPAVPDRCG
jgi:hypothetical protein